MLILDGQQECSSLASNDVSAVSPLLATFGSTPLLLGPHKCGRWDRERLQNAAPPAGSIFTICNCFGENGDCDATFPPAAPVSDENATNDTNDTYTPPAPLKGFNTLRGYLHFEGVRFMAPAVPVNGTVGRERW